MNTNQILSFLTLAELGSYQKAAVQTHYSRSTVMEHIQALERELGVALFGHQGRCLVLTPAGKRFRLHAQTMFQVYQEALSDAMTSSANQSLRVMTIETLGLYFLPTPLSRLLSHHPELDLSVQFATSNTFLDELRRGEADIAFQFAGPNWSFIPASEFRQVPICRERVVFFANPTACLARKPDLSIRDLADARLILTKKDGIYNRFLRDIQRDTGLRFTPLQYIDSGSLLKQFVMDHDCVSLLSRRVIQEELDSGKLVELPLLEEELVTDVVALFPAAAEENSSLQELLQLAVKTLAEAE